MYVRHAVVERLQIHPCARHRANVRRLSLRQRDRGLRDVRHRDEPADAGRIGREDPVEAARVDADEVAPGVRMGAGRRELDVDGLLRPRAREAEADVDQDLSARLAAQDRGLDLAALQRGDSRRAADPRAGGGDVEAEGRGGRRRRHHVNDRSCGPLRC